MANELDDTRTTELNEQIRGVIHAAIFDIAPQRREEIVQGVVQILTRHEDAQQVRGQIAEAIARQRLADRGVDLESRGDRQSWIDMCGYLADAVMDIVAPILTARDIVTERAESLLRITDRLAKTVAEQEQKIESLQRQLDALRRHRSITEGFDNQDGLPR
jgi:uncharacterized membrane-anchored protein YjiN (DUF445 family)